MKKVTNFLLLMRAQQYESLNAWYFFSCCAFFLTVVLLISTNIYQSIQIISSLQNRKQLLAKKSMVTTVHQSISSLEQQEKKLQQQLTVLHSYESSCSASLALLKLLSQTIPADVVLTRFSYHYNQQLQLEGNSYHLQSLTNFINNLQTDNRLKLALIDSLNQTLDSEKNIPVLHFKLMASLN